MRLKEKLHYKFCETKTKDRLYYLTHEVRRPLTDLVVICDVLREARSKEEYQKIYGLLNMALSDFDQVIREYDKVSSGQR